MAYYFTSKIREEIGRNLLKARRQKKLKQVEVAVEAGINPSYYGKMERGLVNFSMEKFFKVTKVLGVKSLDILPF